MSIFKQYKELRKGTKRAIIVGSIFLPIFGGGYLTNWGTNWIPGTVLVCLPIYWILVFSGVWVNTGYKDEKKIADSPKPTE